MKKYLIASLLVAVSGNSAWAVTHNSVTGFSLDLLAGPSFVGNGIGTQFAIGGNLEYRFDPSWSVGLFGTYESTGSQSTSVSSSNIVSLAVDGNYYFNQALDGFYAGVKLGLGISNTSLSGALANGSTSNTVFMFGPAVGYDFLMASALTLGAEINFLTYSAPNSSAGSSTTSILNALIRLGYHF
jgi:hypothetical protein